MVRISKVAFAIFGGSTNGLDLGVGQTASVVPREWIHNAIEFTHIMLDMLEQYSKGRILTIQTNKRIKRKKVKGAKSNNGEQQEDEEFIVNDPNDDVNEINFLEEDSSSDEEEFQERKFNFVAEISILVDYTVASQYVETLRRNEFQANLKV
jgi:hypothetical protein